MVRLGHIAYSNCIPVHARVLESERAKADRLREEEAAALRDQVAHLARVAALDVLSGSLAHEITQPLSALSANAESARPLMDASDAVRRAARHAG